MADWLCDLDVFLSDMKEASCEGMEYRHGIGEEADLCRGHARRVASHGGKGMEISFSFEREICWLLSDDGALQDSISSEDGCLTTQSRRLQCFLSFIMSRDSHILGARRPN